MAWIETHQSLVTHRKTMIAADSLEVEPVQVVGHMVALWLWSLDNAPDGHLADSPRIISRAAFWPGEPERFVTALESAGYLDRNGTGWAIHDWDQYAGRLIERRKQNAERMRRARAPHDTRTDSERAGATVPYPTEHDSTEETDSKARSAPSALNGDQAYLLEKLRKAERWQPLSFGAVVKLNKEYGRGIVTMALQRAAEERDSVELTSGPYPLLEAMAKDIQRIQGEA